MILEHGGLFEDIIPEEIFTPNYDRLYRFFVFSNLHEIASRQTDDVKVIQARLDIQRMTKQDKKLCDEMVDIIYHSTLNFFSDLSVNEAMILSQRTRKDRVKKIRNGNAEPFQEISLKPYV